MVEQKHSAKTGHNNPTPDVVIVRRINRMKYEVDAYWRVWSSDEWAGPIEMPAEEGA